MTLAIAGERFDAEAKRRRPPSPGEDRQGGNVKITEKTDFPLKASS